MNKQLMIDAGFGRQVQLVELGMCPICEKPVSNAFRNEISRREYEISGICQACQDFIFTEPKEE